MKKELIYLLIFIFSFYFVDTSVMMNEMIYNSISVVINEVVYDPTQSESYNEWIEIYNNGNESINLSDWNLCNNKLLSGYVNRSRDVNLNTIMILEPSQYAIITDGESGTEVYNNFNIKNNSIALHVDAASLCNDLDNGGDNITIKNSSKYIIDSFNYTNKMGADGNGMSLCKLDNLWYECNPTPGFDNTEGIVGNYSVSRVIDGDTLILFNKEKIRLIGIDTPEIGEFYYKEATNRLKELVEGKYVILERDVGNIDTYDRLLRYVYINNTFVNIILVEEGYARAYPFEPNIKYEKEFDEAEERARENRLGMWFNVPNITILSPEDNSVITTHSFWFNVTIDQNSTCEYTISHSWEESNHFFNFAMNDNNTFQFNFTNNLTISDNNTFQFNFTNNLTISDNRTRGIGNIIVSHPMDFDISDGFVHSKLINDSYYNNTNSLINEKYGLDVKCTNEDELFSLKGINFIVNMSEYDEEQIPINDDNNDGDNNDGPGGGSSSPDTYTININELSSLSLARDDKAEFVFNGEEHSLKVNSIYTDYIIVTVSSTPQEIRINMDEIKYVDLNLDGQYDIYIKVNDINYNSANVEIKKIIKEIGNEIKESSKKEIIENENETVSNNPVIGRVTEEIKSSPVIGGIIIFSIIFIGLIFYFIFRKRK